MSMNAVVNRFEMIAISLSVCDFGGFFHEALPVGAHIN